jgi:hypothetical protein
VVGAASAGAAVESLEAPVESDSEPSAFLQPANEAVRMRAAKRVRYRVEVMTVGEEGSAFNYLCRRQAPKGFPVRDSDAENGGD